MAVSRRLLLPLVLLLVSVRPAASQVVVRGTVSDAETGETLPAANVQVEGTYTGTISNDEGTYQIEVGQLPVTLVVRYIGYRTARRTVDPQDSEAGSVQLDVALQPAVYQMAEVTVTGEDPAIRIMREVIRRKQQWRVDLETYRARAYSRLTFRNDTGIVAIVETITDAFWDREEGMREVVLSRRQTENIDWDQLLPAAALMTNYYDDDIPMAGHRLVGVTHPDALDVYDFRLVGTRVMDEQVVYDIDVRPKRKTASAFVGRVSVLGEEYALLEVRLKPGSSFVFPPPLERMEVEARQQFTNSGGDFWLPVDYRSHVVVKIGMGALLGIPTIYLDQVTRLTDYAVNVALPDSLYQKDGDAAEVLVRADSASVAADSLLDTADAVPLTPLEARAYVTVDSTLTMERAYEPTGLMARFVEMESEEGGGEVRAGGRDWVDLRPRLWFNRVEALHGGAAVEVRPLRVLSLEGRAGYSTGLDGAEHWNYGGQSTLRFGPDRRAFAEARAGAGARPLARSDFYGRTLNSLDVLLAAQDYFDYYRSTRLEGRVGYRFEPWGATFAVTAGAEEPSPLQASTGYDLFGDEAPPRSNPPIPDRSVRHLGLELTLGEEAMPDLLQIAGSRRLEAGIEYGSEGLGGDYGYTRLAASGTYRVPTFFRRRMLPNTLDLRFSGQKTWGELPAVRRVLVDGRMGPFAPFGVLKTLDPLPYVGEEAASFFWEHNFRTVPFEWLGLDALARRFYGVLVYGGHARTWSSGDAAPALHGSDGWHHEVGVGLSGLFQVLRLDLTARLDEPEIAVTLSASKLF